MKIHRFYLPATVDHKIAVGEVIKLDNRELYNQIINVFRARRGEQFSFFNFDLFERAEYLVNLHDYDKKVMEFTVVSESLGLVQSGGLALGFANLKKENTELVLDMCTQLGVSHFEILTTDRTIKLGQKEDRLYKTLVEATEQSGFVKVPTLSFGKKVGEYMTEILKGNSLPILLQMGDSNLGDIKKIMSSSPDKSVVLLVGPEGGWSTEELLTFKDLGIERLALGNQTLRAETACVAGVSSLL